MTFTGFANSKYPEYEVKTPQTKLDFSIRTLTVREEERLKGSFKSPNKLSEHLNKCIFDALVEKPASITDLKTFTSSLTIKDRDALLYALYHITYEEVRDYDVTCASCSKDFPVTIKASDTFSYTEFPTNDILTKKVRVPLKLTKNVTAIIKQPSLADEIESMRSLIARPGSSSDTVNEILIIDSFEEENEISKEPKVYDENIDIMDAYLSLPSMDKRQINKEYVENFGKYCCEFKMRTYCPSCGSEEVVDIDLVNNFFRMVFSG